MVGLLQHPGAPDAARRHRAGAHLSDVHRAAAPFGMPVLPVVLTVRDRGAREARRLSRLLSGGEAHCPLSSAAPRRIRSCALIRSRCDG